MKIGFDAKRAFKNKTGLGNYSRNLISAFQKFFPENDYVLFTPTLNNSLFDTQFLKNIQIISPKVKLLKSYWRSFQLHSLIQKNTCDIYHGLSAELPFGIKSGKTKYIVTIHDLIYERYPELYPSIDRKIYRFKTKYACNKADKIIATSEQTKQDIIQFLGIESEKIEVVYQNCQEEFSLKVDASTKESIQKKYNLPKRYLLTVGTIEKRKNVAVILRTLNQLPSDIKLVVVGKPTAYMDELANIIQSENIADRVHFLHEVSFDELPAIYQMAEIFIYPSRFEGFGIPILEAMNSDLPVIAATGSCLEEVGGTANLYFQPDDEKILTNHILSILNDESLRLDIIAQNKIHRQKFTAKTFAQSTLNVYKEALKN